MNPENRKEFIQTVVEQVLIGLVVYQRLPEEGKVSFKDNLLRFVSIADQIGRGRWNQINYTEIVREIDRRSKRKKQLKLKEFEKSLLQYGVTTPAGCHTNVTAAMKNSIEMLAEGITTLEQLRKARKSQSGAEKVKSGSQRHSSPGIPRHHE